MEVFSQNVITLDEEKALNCLFDAFGSAFSIEEIASAYCKASRNADLAGEILYRMKGSSSTSVTHSSNLDAKAEESLVSSDGHSSINSCYEGKNLRSKVFPASTGSVSTFLGKDYVRPMPPASGSHGVTKPIKLDAKGLPVTGIWRERSKQNISKHDQLHQDMEDFLFKMLGDGFQLDRNMIREILDTCGYDMQKSLEKLLDRSNMASDKRTSVSGESVGKFTDMKPKSEAPSSGRKSQNLDYLRGDGNIVSVEGVESHQPRKGRRDLEQEVLSHLFNYREHSEEAPKKIGKNLKKSTQYGRVVLEPPEDSKEEYKTDMNFSRRENEDDAEDEEDYQQLRKAVKEYRTTMNEYYKSAVNAFAKGDHVKAGKLLEEGQFFLQKAREADEESSKMILEKKITEEQVMTLDMHDHEPKEAIRLLKKHLSLLFGISAFEYLKVIVDANDQENNGKGSRRHRAIIKLLEQESLEWSKGEMAGTILIRMDSTEPKRLSFVKT